MNSRIEKTLPICAVACLCLVMAIPAFAGLLNEITELSFDKTTYSIGEPTTLTVAGKGTCSGIAVEWGDGQKTIIDSFTFSDQNKAFPKLLQVKHTFTEVKTFAVHVKAGLITSCGDLALNVNVTSAPVNKAMEGASQIAKAAQNVNPQSTVGKFESMSFNKPANVSYLVNEPATLTIRGTGSCRKIEIKWGDGQITTFPSHNFSERSNLVATHAYVAAGSYAVHLGDGQDATTWCYSLDAYVSVITPPVNKTLPGKGVK